MGLPMGLRKAGFTKEGKPHPRARSEGGQRRYARADVLALLGEGRTDSEKSAAPDTRVGTGEQAETGNPERQRLMKHALTRR